MELLAPAGSLDKLKVAFSYGADAVYLSGQKFGLRTAADNFTPNELREATQLAKSAGKKIYVVLNGFLHDQDLDELPEFLKLLDELCIDALIASDLGVIKTIAQYCSLPIHLSTQASCLNLSAGEFWKKMGVSRLILGREVSLSEAAKIKKLTGLEIEMFIHGSMCMAYSGNCTISNYTAGRDSNRGGCAHSCRFEYSFNSTQAPAFFMSSKDLNGLSLLKEYLDAGIDSVKVEGRMKSALYTGSVSKVYSQAIKELKTMGFLSQAKLNHWKDELLKFSHRDYTTASLVEKAGPESIFTQRESSDQNPYISIGEIRQVVKDHYMLLEVRNPFYRGDELEVLPFEEGSKRVETTFLLDISNRIVEKTKPGTLVKLPYIAGVETHNLVRMKNPCFGQPI